ncbi:MAG: phosphatase PAP2 family protein [bacterium]
MKSVLFIFLLFFISQNADSQHIFKTKRDPSKYSESNSDIKIFRVFNNMKGGFVNSLVNITNNSITPVTIAAPVGLYITSRINKNDYDESSAILLALSEGTSAVFTYALKKTFKRDRPFRTLNNVNLTDTSNIAGTYSFPSGHASGSFVISTALTLRYPDKPGLIIGLYAWSTLVSLGRMYWGVHYPSDVLTGMLVGAGSAALIYSLRVPIIKEKNKLFNQSNRTESYSSNINTSAFLISLAATDLINYFITNSDNPILKRSQINFTSSSINNNLSYTFNF